MHDGPPLDLPRAQQRAHWVQRGLIGLVGLDVLVAVLLTVSWAVTTMAPDTWSVLGVLDALDGAIDALDVPRRLVELGVRIGFLAWWAAVVANARAISPAEFHVKTFFAIGIWLFPVVNLFAPYQLARQIERASGAEPAPTVPRWWGAFLARGLVQGLVGRLVTGSSFGVQTLQFVAGTALSAVAAWYCVAFVRHIDEAQRRASVSAEEIARVFE
ncbi:MAG: DUF4328 domain-containing protein [Sandaracinus sp.]